MKIFFADEFASISADLLSFILVLFIVLVVVVALAVSVIKKPKVKGLDDMIGMQAKAATDISPAGNVLYSGEIWKATTEGETISKGAPVRITGKEGLTLLVEPMK